MSSTGLELQYQTPAGWAVEALKDPEGLLSDHAHCEKKAAITALNLSLSLADSPKASVLLARLAEEELNHYRRVLEILQARGWRLRADGGNAYAKALLESADREGPRKLLDRLLVAALIEARSCERLKLLEEATRENRTAGQDAWLDLLIELERCEAGHATAFKAMATERFGAVALERLAEWLKLEALAIQTCPWRSAIH
jgi:tRNA-(ms[2]io[6]A)-hydroxylase